MKNFLSESHISSFR